jgi:hypothetical protein
MELVRFGRWTLRVDQHKTERVYQGCVGAPERCDCDECRNFSVARHQVYPPTVLDLLEKLGINPVCEAEVYWVGPSERDPALHTYEGWFNFIGSVEPEAAATEPVMDMTEQFDIESAKRGPFYLFFAALVAWWQISLRGLLWHGSSSWRRRFLGFLMHLRPTTRVETLRQP